MTRAPGILDVHAHIIPPTIPFGRTAARFPRLEITSSQCRLVSGALARTTRAGAWDLAAREADMERGGVAAQVLSPLPELFCYWAPRRDAIPYCRALNHWLSDACRQRADERFEAVGAVPLQFPDQAAEMLYEVKDLGLRGVEVGTSIRDHNLAHRRFDEFFAEAERLDLCVFVHPYQPPRADFVEPPVVAAAVLFPGEVANTVLGLIARGHLERHPRLRLLFAHGGGSFSLAIDRLNATWRISDELRACIPNEPISYARRMWFDSLLWGSRPLDYLVRLVGRERIVAGSDYPFGGDPVLLAPQRHARHDVRDEMTHHARLWLGC
jgi:aminocarboxymuconate-semialdehyde decarboxylase